MKPVVIGVAGGTGSGKSTVVRQLQRRIHPRKVAILEQDAYYRSQEHVSPEQRLKINYDHPSAFDNRLYLKHIRQLMRGEAVHKPVYDFKTHTRSKKTVRVEPGPVIILEGILILSEKSLRELMDIKVFVDTDADVRVIRRLMRDIRRRGRTIESVVEQYLNMVRPMHQQFIEPSKRYADIILPEGGYNRVAIDLLVTKVESLFQKRNRSRLTPRP